MDRRKPGTGKVCNQLNDPYRRGVAERMSPEWVILFPTWTYLMDRTSSISFSQNAIQALDHDSALATLPSDVLPNIYSRLPASDFFALARVSKQVQHSIQTLLPEAIRHELRALSTHYSDNIVEPLAILLRLGGHHISDEDWTNFLRKCNSFIDQMLAVVLLKALTRQDAAIRKHPYTIEIARSRIHPHNYYNLKFATMHCAAVMKQLMRMERMESVDNAKPFQRSTSPEWKQLGDIFRILSPAEQIDLLLQVEPREMDCENNGLAFDELVAIHLDFLAKPNSFATTDRLLWRGPPAKRAAYFDILSNAYKMARTPEHPTYFQEIFSGKTYVGLAGKPWREDTPEHCRFVLRLLAYETRTNLVRNPKTFAHAIKSEVEGNFLSWTELIDFNKTVNVRIGQGMRLEDAVNMWIDENRNPSGCVIS
jgi:hypothetical protein